MLLPLLFIGVTVTIGSVGIVKTIKAGVEATKAQKINDGATDLINNSIKRSKMQRTICEQSLDQLRKEKQFVQNDKIKVFLESFEKIQNIDPKSIEGLEGLKKLYVDHEQTVTPYLMSGITRNALGGAVIGVASGSVISIAVYKLARILAHASTGTAITSLEGAAAKNATLAFLGGGSLATGGLGIAGGTVILGALVVCPALFLMGIFAGKTAKKNLESAYMNQAEAVRVAEQIDALSVQYESIQKRLDVFCNFLERLDDYFIPLISKLDNILKTEGSNYSLYSNESKETIASCASIAATIKAVRDTHLLDIYASVPYNGNSYLSEIHIGGERYVKEP